MKSLISRLAHLGIDSTVTPELARKIYYTNLYAVALCIICASFVPVYFFAGFHLLATLAAAGSLIYVGVGVLNVARRYTLARASLIVCSNIILYVFSSYLSRNSGVHFWFFPSLAVPFVIFGPKQRLAIYLSECVTIGSLAIIWGTGFRNPWIPSVLLPPGVQLIVSISTIIFSSLLVIAPMSFLSADYESKSDLSIVAANRSSNYFKALDAACIIALTNKKGIITYVNQRFCEISGYTEEELIGKTHALIRSPQHSREFFSEMWRTIQAKEIWRGEICNRAKSGELYWVDTSIVPLLDVNGEIERYVSIRYDITQRKLAEQSAVQSAKLAALGEMAAGIAHEVNNPIGVIRGKAAQMRRLMTADTKECHAANDGLTKIIQMTDRVNSIVRGLLLYSRNGQRDPFVAMRLDKVVSGVAEFWEPRLRKDGVQLTISIPKDIEVSCQEVQLGQVIANLIGNASDAIQTLSEKWIRIETQFVGERAHLTITDSGSGIPAELAAKVMQPFFTTKEVGKGTGLGLSVSKGIVEDHGGRLWLNSDSPHTQFVVEIPAHSVPAKAVA